MNCVTSYGLDDRVSTPGSGKNFSLRHHVQTDAVVYPSSYLMDTRDSSLGGKALGAENWPPTSVQRRI